jgi:hypothetical protein
MKRKATRITEPATMPVSYTVSIIKLGGEFVCALLNIEGEVLKHIAHLKFNTALVLMMNETRGYFIKETILYNGSERIVYFNWPPQLSLEFIESFYNKKKPADK